MPSQGGERDRSFATSFPRETITRVSIPSLQLGQDQLCSMPEWGSLEETLMPELPEVETMVRGLRPAFLGRFVERIEVHDPFLLQGCDAEEFERRGRMVQVEEVARRGKWVAITLSDHR